MAAPVLGARSSLRLQVAGGALPTDMELGVEVSAASSMGAGVERTGQSFRMAKATTIPRTPPVTTSVG